MANRDPVATGADGGAAGGSDGVGVPVVAGSAGAAGAAGGGAAGGSDGVGAGDGGTVDTPLRCRICLQDYRDYRDCPDGGDLLCPDCYDAIAKRREKRMASEARRARIENLVRCPGCNEWAPHLCTVPSNLPPPAPDKVMCDNCYGELFRYGLWRL